MTTNSAVTGLPRSKLAQFLDKRLDELKGTTTLLEIARKMGYPRGHSRTAPSAFFISTN